MEHTQRRTGSRAKRVRPANVCRTVCRKFEKLWGREARGLSRLFHGGSCIGGEIRVSVRAVIAVPPRHVLTARKRRADRRTDTPFDEKSPTSRPSAPTAPLPVSAAEGRQTRPASGAVSWSSCIFVFVFIFFFHSLKFHARREYRLETKRALEETTFRRRGTSAS